MASVRLQDPDSLPMILLTAIEGSDGKEAVEFDNKILIGGLR